MMAVSQEDDVLTALARQAVALDARAERLRAEAREVAQQAADLRVEINRRTRRPIEILARPAVPPERDLDLLSRIASVLEEGPCRSALLAKRLGIPSHRALAALKELERGGTVTRSGIRRGTIWGLRSDEELNGHAAHATANSLVRDAARKLDTFTFDEINAALPMLTEGAIRRELPKLEVNGIVESERDGRRKLYAFVHPTGPVVNRPKVVPPEANVIELLRKAGSPVAGTGKATPVRKDVGELLEACTAAGLTIERAAKHWRVLYGDTTVTTVPQTPSDHRSLLNARAAIKRHSGIDVRAGS